MVKRPLTRITYPVRLSARFGPPLAVVRLFRRHAAGLWAALDTLEPIPKTTLLSAQEAKERLREIVERFFFRRLKGEDTDLRNLDTATEVHRKSGG
jgi:hypothetical protein